MATPSEKPVQTYPNSTTRDDDDASVATATAGKEIDDIANNFSIEINDTTPTHQEKTIKFIFRVDNATQASNVSTGHYQWLDKVVKIYDKRIKVMDNFGRHMKKFEVGSAAEYATHFNIHHRPANDQHKRKAMYTIIHRVYTTLSLRELRGNAELASIMQFYKMNLSNHDWTEDVVSTVSFGFFVNHDPTNEPKSSFETKIRNKIASTTKTSKNKIPNFKCTFTAPSIDHNGMKLRCKAFDIQCERQHSKDFHKLLTRTYASSADFMFFKARYHKDNTIFKKAIVAQNTYLGNLRTIPIQGISPDLMFYLENDILQAHGIAAIHAHRDTDSKGRWNLETTVTQFTQATQLIKRNLTHWAHKYKDETETPATNFPPPSLSFKNTSYSKSSDLSDSSSDTGSFQSWFTTCTDSYSSISLTEASNFNNHDDDLPVAQAWNLPTTSPPPVITTETTTTAPSSAITDQLQKDNDGLRQIIADLHKQNASIVKELAAIKQQNAQQTSPPPALPDLAMLEIMITRIVDQKARDNDFPPFLPSPSPNRKKANQQNTPERANFPALDDNHMHTDP